MRNVTRSIACYKLNSISALSLRSHLSFLSPRINGTLLDLSSWLQLIFLLTRVEFWILHDIFLAFCLLIILYPKVDRELEEEYSDQVHCLKQLAIDS